MEQEFGLGPGAYDVKGRPSDPGKNDTIAVPGEKPKSIATRLLFRQCGTGRKRARCIPMPMTKECQRTGGKSRGAVQKIEELLDAGKRSDISDTRRSNRILPTFMYTDGTGRRFTMRIGGVTSFCARQQHLFPRDWWKFQPGHDSRRLIRLKMHWNFQDKGFPMKAGKKMLIFVKQFLKKRTAGR